MRMLDRLSQALNEIVKYVAAFLLAAMTILVFLQVWFRYVLNHPLDWSEELASFTFVWMALLGASIGLERNEHPRLDLLANQFPERLHRAVRALYNGAILFMLLVLAFYGARLTASMRSQLTAALGYSVSYVYAVLPVSAGIMFVHLIIQTFRLIFVRAAEEPSG